MVTATGEEHGLINTLANSVTAAEGYKNMEPKVKSELEKKHKDDERMVKVKYINMRGKHERLTKPYCRYAGDPIRIYHLIPGYSYDLPYGFVKEVNGIKIPKRSGLLSEDGVNVRKDGAPLETDQQAEQLHMLVGEI